MAGPGSPIPALITQINSSPSFFIRTDVNPAESIRFPVISPVFMSPEVRSTKSRRYQTTHDHSYSPSNSESFPAELSPIRMEVQRAKHTDFSDSFVGGMYRDSRMGVSELRQKRVLRLAKKRQVIEDAQEKVQAEVRRIEMARQQQQLRQEERRRQRRARKAVIVIQKKVRAFMAWNAVVSSLAELREKRHKEVLIQNSANKLQVWASDCLERHRNLIIRQKQEEEERKLNDKLSNNGINYEMSNYSSSEEEEEEEEEGIQGLSLVDYYKQIESNYHVSAEGGNESQDNTLQTKRTSSSTDHGFEQMHVFPVVNKEGTQTLGRTPRGRSTSVVGSNASNSNNTVAVGSGVGRRGHGGGAPQGSEDSAISSRPQSREFSHSSTKASRELEGVEAPITSLVGVVVSLLTTHSASLKKNSNKTATDDHPELEQEDLDLDLDLENEHAVKDLEKSINSAIFIEKGNSEMNNNTESNHTHKKSTPPNSQNSIYTILKINKNSDNESYLGANKDSNRMLHTKEFKESEDIIVTADDLISKYSSDIYHEEKLQWGATRIQQEMRGKINREQLLRKRRALVKFAWFFGCFFKSCPTVLREKYNIEDPPWLIDKTKEREKQELDNMNCEDKDEYSLYAEGQTDFQNKHYSEKQHRGVRIIQNVLREIQAIRRMKREVREAKRKAAKKAASLAKEMLCQFPNEEGPDLSKDFHWLKQNQTSESSLHMANPHQYESLLLKTKQPKVGPIDLSRSMRGAFWLHTADSETPLKAGRRMSSNAGNVRGSSVSNIIGGGVRK